MKKVSLILAALALVLGISQCKKQEKPVASGEKQHIVLNASFGDSNAKIAEDGIGGLKWTVGDVINVSQNGQSLSAEGLKCTDVANGIFEGDITATTGNITFTFGELKYADQSGELNDAISLTAEAPYDKNGNYNVTMTMPYAVLKLDLSPLGTSGEMTIAVADKVIASVTDVETPDAVFVAVPANNELTEYKIGFCDNIATKYWQLLPNSFYSSTNGSGEGSGASIVIAPAPKFSVSETTTVTFAPGYLYYDGSESKWKFEAHQWDFRTYEGGGAVIDGSTTTTEAGDWGLFGFSTTASNYGMKTRKPEGEGDNWEIDYEGDFVDWGSNVIGTDAANTWRTLTKAEWVFLIGKADDSHQEPEPCRDNASSLRAWKELDGGHKGLVILPDGTNASVMSSITTLAQLATYGAVFLPASGYRLGTVIHDVGVQGNCWASSLNNGFPHYFYFSHAALYPIRPSASGNRYYGQSVRLVKED